ncbi:PREDICTED: uncharacterized protein LOC105116508 [Populus euphratica]|uniref:Uncharacterized protein LOC105116508 n=1 Tax=Populus euphratica TaxID=75702 RepID=A0AAJ6TIY3_POPEU|nr:PREDICTED: uncharacterized protein LOC105116508 [Populus euphratica]
MESKDPKEIYLQCITPFKIESFSLLLKTKVEKYESDVFEAGGHKWSLCLYPNGNTKGKGKDFVSLYLQIENTSNLPHRWEVNAKFKLFVFYQINNKYLTVQESDGLVKRFHEMTTEWGFDQLLSHETLNDASNGYLVKDCCVFGAEIFVIEPTGKWELLSMVKKPANGSLTWKIEDFSKLDKSSYLSKAFTAEAEVEPLLSFVVNFGSSRRFRRIDVSPKGNAEAKGDSLSVFLELVDGGKLPPKKTVWAECKLRVLDQRHDKHVEKTISRWLTSSNHTRGFRKFMPLGDLHEVSKGYVLNDTLIVEAEILTLSVSKLFS